MIVGCWLGWAVLLLAGIDDGGMCRCKEQCCVLLLLLCC